MALVVPVAHPLIFALTSMGLVLSRFTFKVNFHQGRVKFVS
jgi:hypothetical protein